MLAPPLDGAPLPGVDLACNAMYLSLVGESPEVYCPPGCTLQATTHGTIYVLDHVRRIGYPLQLPTVSHTAAPQPQFVAPPPPVPCAAPTPPPAEPSASVPLAARLLLGEGGVATPQPPQPSLKRSRASSLDSRTPSSSHVGWERRRPASPEPMLDPTAVDAPYDGTGSVDDEERHSRPLSPSAPAMKEPLTIVNSPQFCLIPPQPQWFRVLLNALQAPNGWINCRKVFIFCHYCRTYFVSKPSAVWAHLSATKGHRVQRQRVRCYMNNGMHLLTTAEKRLLQVVSPEEIDRVPSKHFQHADRIQRVKSTAFVPACVRQQSLLTHEQRQRIVRDGAPLAEKIILREDLQGSTPQSYATEKPQLVGWRFLMEGLDLVECRCKRTDEVLEEWTISDHHKPKERSR